MNDSTSLVTKAVAELKQYGEEAKQFAKEHPVVSALVVYLVLDFLKDKRK